jgi:predicted SnoaL-like aldol condensation-catalyzing enzyme
MFLNRWAWVGACGKGAEMSTTAPITPAAALAQRFAGAVAEGDATTATQLLAPTVTIVPGGVLSARTAAEAIIERGGRHELLTAVASQARVAHLVGSTDGAERFEGLNVFRVADGAISGVMQLASAANGAPAAATPTTQRRAPVHDAARAVEANIALVRRFYAETFGNGNVAALDELVAEGYIQHNPWIGQGRAGLAKLIELTGAAPMEGLGSGGAFGEGDFVVHLSQLPFGDDFHLVDLFRVEGGVLAEHWDFTPIGMPLPMPPGAAPISDG